MVIKLRKNKQIKEEKSEFKARQTYGDVSDIVRQTYKEMSEVLVRMQEETQQKVGIVQDQTFRKMLDQYTEAIKDAYNRTQGNARGRFLERLASQTDRIEVIFKSPLDKVLYIDRATSLSELLCQIVYYKTQTSRSDSELANWLERSRPTAYRLRRKAMEYYEGNTTAQEAMKAIDLVREPKNKE